MAKLRSITKILLGLKTAVRSGAIMTEKTGKDKF
jgi:hypothetical protein